MQHYLYLIIDLLSILFPFLFSFHPRANFSKKWKYLWPAILIPAVIFIVWDNWFTSMGVWGFNPDYTVGIYLSPLPLEEILFFICIPYACVFTYEAVHFFINSDPLKNGERIISITLVIVLFAVGLFHYDKWYTSVTFISTSVVVAILSFRKAPYLSKFYFAFLFILIPFFIVNGILTGTGIPEPVVWYNNSENMGVRMGTIPFEDTFYGMLLLLMNVALFETLQMRDLKR